MITIGKAVQPAVPKPQQKAPVEPRKKARVVASNDSDDKPILPATSKPQNKARVATDKAVQPARKAQVTFNNSGDEVIQSMAPKPQKEAVAASHDSDVETAQPATVTIKEGQPDQPSNDEDEQAQIIHLGVWAIAVHGMLRVLICLCFVMVLVINKVQV
ncbi:hypothetical protein BDN71DRAFT_1430365 [Pleurotus eryngii]|uniref:Uncharacterized protein n=1 Tax=Pleurotus eryngii TaxID=5323 RepID=A0A9P5ZXF2_PLEER|nr:hypothetical protein BDN71DRAFT_1430365 [Pleurotus eryngii]